jgi:hypothetical protein
MADVEFSIERGVRMNKHVWVSIVLLIVLPDSGCWKAAQMDYGQPAAQFNEEAVLTKAKPYVGQKITVKGVVTRQDLSDGNNCRIYLGHSICCNLGKFKEMAAGYTVGKTVSIDGFLKRCEEGDILLEPALGRDPHAEFKPIE